MTSAELHTADSAAELLALLRALPYPVRLISVYGLVSRHYAWCVRVDEQPQQLPADEPAARASKPSSKNKGA